MRGTQAEWELEIPYFLVGRGTGLVFLLVAKQELPILPSCPSLRLKVAAHRSSLSREGLLIVEVEIE